MIDNPTKDKLIALRAEGWSYDRIGKELGISSSTAYDWGAKLKNEIDKLRAIRLDAIQERAFGDYEHELTWLGNELKRVQAELRDRDYGYMDPPQLHWYLSVLMNKIDKKRAQLEPPALHGMDDANHPESNKIE